MRTYLVSATALAAIAMAALAQAQNLGLPDQEVGTLVTSASSRIGDHVDWGRPECGEPKYLAGTCVWTLGPNFSLTANVLDRSDSVGTIVSRWQHFDLKNTTNRKVFDQTCRALVAALRPNWPAEKVSKFTSALIGAARKDHEVKAEGIAFAFYVWPETLTCEAQPAT